MTKLEKIADEIAIQLSCDPVNRVYFAEVVLRVLRRHRVFAPRWINPIAPILFACGWLVGGLCYLIYLALLLPLGSFDRGINKWLTER